MSNNTQSNQCMSLPPATPQQQASTLAQIANSIGANATCSTMANNTATNAASSSSSGQTSASTDARTSATTVAASGSTSGVVVTLGGGGAATAGFSTGASTADSAAASAAASSNAAEQASYNSAGQQMSQSGCGTIAIDATNIANASNIIQCAVKNSMTSSSAVVVANAVINFNALGSPDQGKIFMAQNLATNLAIALKYSAMDTMNLINAYTAPYANIGSINLTGAQIAMKVTGSVSTQCVISNTTQTVINAAQQQIASAVANSVMNSSQGTAALAANARSAASNNQTTANNTAGSDIQSQVQNIEAKVSSSGVININCGGYLNMANIVINQDIVASLISNLLINNAITTGMAASAETITSSQNTRSTSSSSAGLDAVVAAGNKGNADAIGASGTAGANASTASGDAAAKAAVGTGTAAALAAVGTGDAAAAAAVGTGKAAAEAATATGNAVANMMGGNNMIIGAVIICGVLYYGYTKYGKVIIVVAVVMVVMVGLYLKNKGLI